jgi:hypothetical protein
LLTQSAVDQNTPVSYLELCAQYEQSSLQPPVLMFIKVHICTAEGEWKRLWSVPCV